jgi:hypothetical protein
MAGGTEGVASQLEDTEVVVVAAVMAAADWAMAAVD